MSDDLERLLARRDAWEIPRPGRTVVGSPAFLGQVTSTGTNIAAGKFLLVNPVVVTGAEAEGGTPIYTADTSHTVPVYLARGTPATGDYLLCRRADHRWVAEPGRLGGSGGTIGIGLPGCVCTSIPASLAVTVTYGTGEDVHTYSGALIAASLGYYTTTSPPPYLPVSAMSGNGFYSTSSWIDDNGITDYYRFTCNSGLFTIWLGQNTGVWQSPFQAYNWSTSTSPNTCSPFSLTSGFTQPGLVFNGKFFVSG